jgi:hypothetical protein
MLAVSQNTTHVLCNRYLRFKRPVSLLFSLFLTGRLSWFSFFFLSLDSILISNRVCLLNVGNSPKRRRSLLAFLFHMRSCTQRKASISSALFIYLFILPTSAEKVQFHSHLFLKWWKGCFFFSSLRRGAEDHRSNLILIKVSGFISTCLTL